MSLENIKPGYLLYLKGAAEDRLNKEFESIDHPVNAYRNELISLISTYGALPERLGDVAATLVGRLPYEGTFGAEDAYVGWKILEETNAALAELLEDDEILKKQARGDATTTDEEDAYMRRQAKDFEIDYNIDRPKLNAYDESARSIPDEIDDEGTRDSFYRGNTKNVEEHIRHSARDERHVPVSKTIKLFVPAPTPPGELITASNTQAKNSPHPASPTPEKAKPLDVTIQAPDFAGKTPTDAFRKGMKWLAEHIAAVATGSKHIQDSPRLAPIIDLKDVQAELTTNSAQILRLIENMRSKFQKLRAPSDGDIDGMLERLKDIDPRDPNSIFELRDLMRGQLGNNHKEGDWQQPWEEGGWKD